MKTKELNELNSEHKLKVQENKDYISLIYSMKSNIKDLRRMIIRQANQSQTRLATESSEEDL